MKIFLNPPSKLPIHDNLNTRVIIGTDQMEPYQLQQLRIREGRYFDGEMEEEPKIYELRKDSDKYIMEEDIDIPSPQWPVSVLEEEFEELLHPGDEKTIMSVPKFWSPPLTSPDGSFGSLMSSTLASRLGSYVNGKTDFDYVEKGNPNERTIFISLASYRDWQCR